MTKPNFDNDASSKPWYKEFWAWFVFMPLIVVIIACGFTVTLAFKTKDSVVTDDYYKIGKMINSDFKATQMANELGVQANLLFVNGIFSAQLNENKWEREETLLLTLSHPFDKSMDKFITLSQQDEWTWQAKRALELDGRWYLKLSALDDAGMDVWRLQAESHIPAQEPIALK